MSSTDSYPPGGYGRPRGDWNDRSFYARGRSWLGRAEDWLDQRGKPAWIAATVLGFVVFWPVGLALLAYMIWSKRMFSGCAHRRDRFERHAHRWAHHRHGFAPTGNSAFDAYRAETLRRLEDEREEFEAFLTRLREAKDKAEFDQFMDDRARRAREGSDETPDADGTPAS